MRVIIDFSHFAFIIFSTCVRDSASISTSTNARHDSGFLRFNTHYLHTNNATLLITIMQNIRAL